MNKDLKEQIADKCIHFNGLSHQFCKAGINYESVKDRTQRPYKIPCVKNTVMHGSHCSLQQFRTDEEVEKEIKEIENISVIAFGALSIISTRKENNGIIECPKCGGKLHYTRASNGHVWGKCETENCLSWMQ